MSKYWSKLWFLKGGGHFERKFANFKKKGGGGPPTTLGIRKLESLGYHVALFSCFYV